MLHVDDLIEPRPEKILLSFSLRSRGRIPSPKQSRRVNHKSSLQGIPLQSPAFPQSRLRLRPVSRFQINALGILHGRRNNDAPEVRYLGFELATFDDLGLLKD
jgi:hypothetical protein